ncbi:MAG: helix-turn-helix domain-containing protein [Patescibacteria group bacterium]
MADKKALTHPYPLPEGTYERLSQSLYEPLLMHENVVLVCPPLWGRDHNFRYLVERGPHDRQKILKKAARTLHFCSFDLLNGNKLEDELWLNKIISEGKEPVFFINIPESIQDNQLTQFLEGAQKIYYRAPNTIHFILLMDMKWNEEEFFSLIAPFRSLFQNVIRPPYYTEREALHLIDYWLSRWNWQLPKNSRDWIAHEAGGILLLAKAATRVAVKEHIKVLRDLERQIPDHPDFTVQIRFFLSRLTERQQSILESIANDHRVENESEMKHLEAMGCIIQTTNGFRIKSTFVTNFLHKPIKSAKRFLSSLEKTKIFSEREKLLLFKLAEFRGKTLSRDRLAHILWGDDYLDKFSDWALDQAVSRLRRKLADDPTFKSLRITTQKKYGFILL